MESKATQRRKIFNYCMEHGSITNREAFVHLNINSPTARISEMRRSGLYEVKDQKEIRINSSGDAVKYKRYFISERNEANE